MTITDLFLKMHDEIRSIIGEIATIDVVIGVQDEVNLQAKIKSIQRLNALADQLEVLSKCFPNRRK